MSSYDVPIYDGKSETPFKNLKAGTQVFTTGDTLNVNHNKFVKIVWEDSSAYAPVNQLMPQGRLAIITSKLKFTGMIIYSDPIMTKELSLFPDDWQMVVVGREEFPATTVMFKDKGSDNVNVGYIDSSTISTDPTEIEFFKKYIAAEDIIVRTGDNKPMLELKADAKYQSLRAWAFRFEDDADFVLGEDQDGESFEAYSEEGEEGEEGDDGAGAERYSPAYDAFVTPSNWAFVDGDTPLTGSEVPGEFNKFFVYVDGTEVSAKGAVLSNLYPQGTDLHETKEVRKIRFEFIPKEDVDAKFQIEVWNDGYPMTFREELVEPAKANKKYSVTVEDDPNTPIMCGPIRATLWVGNDKKVVTIVEAECGD